MTLILVACTAESAQGSRLRIFAASSLREAFEELGTEFERSHPGSQVELSFAGSQVLRLQIEQGAHPDLFASANAQQVAALTGAGLCEQATRFADNSLVIATPLDNPGQVANFEDLRHTDRLVLGTAEVPVGDYTRRTLALANAEFGPDFSQEVLARVVSFESNVRLARAKVELGEAFAAILYKSDTFESTKLRVVELPDKLWVPVGYESARTVNAPNGALALEWQGWLMSSEGQAILARHGFSPPRP